MIINKETYNKAKKLCIKQNKLIPRELLAEKLNISIMTARNIRALLENESLFKDMSSIIKTDNSETLNLGISGDWHIGSKACKENYIIDYIEQLNNRNIKILILPGDLIDGMFVYKGQIMEVTSVKIDDQILRAREIISLFKGKIYFILGNHDYSVVKHMGIDVGKLFESPNFVYLGATRANLTIDNISMELYHGMGGGGYNISYKLQKVIDSYDETRPRFIFAGHWHTSAYIPSYKSVSALTVGSFQGKTELTERMHVIPQIGGWVMNIKHSGKRVLSEKLEFLPY